jgi:hypothetical protein
LIGNRILVLLVPDLSAQLRRPGNSTRRRRGPCRVTVHTKQLGFWFFTQRNLMTISPFQSLRCITGYVEQILGSHIAGSVTDSDVL